MDLTGHWPAALIPQALSLLRDYELSLISCHFWITGPEWGMKAETKPDDFLFILMAGRIAAEVGGESAVLGPGEILLAEQGELLSACYAQGCSSIEVFALHGFFRDRLHRCLFRGFSSPFARLPEPGAWMARLRDLTGLINSDAPAGSLAGIGLLRWLFLDLLRTGLRLAKAEAPPDARLAYCLRTIQSRFAEDLSVEGLARECGITPTQLRRIFQRYLGRSPKDVLAGQRLDRAAELLRTSSFSVKRVAFETGFRQVHHFHLQFKKFFGHTPSAYRRLESEGM